jgi:hypothetical protein
MGTKIKIKQIDLQGFISASGQVDLLSASNYVSFVTQLDTTMSSDAELAAVSSSISQSIYTLSQTIGSGLVSGSSQLTSSYDTRYVISGSITQTTWDNITNKPTNILSSSQQIVDLGFATTGSNVFRGNQTISGSLDVLIVGGTATGINENPASNNIFWSYIPQDTNTTNIQVGWDAIADNFGSYIVTNVEYNGPFIYITLNDDDVELPYRIRLDFSKPSHLWQFNEDGAISFPDNTLQTTAFTGIPTGSISSSAQISDLGFVTGSYTTINSFNSLTQSFNSISQSFSVISGSVGTIDFSTLATTSSLNTFTSSVNSRLNNIEVTTSSYETKGSGIISGSSQLTSSFDTRYSLSGSSNINTSSFATTGSNSFSGSQTITGSLIVSSVAVVNGALTIPSASVISLTSGSSISVDASGAITGSLTGSVFGIGDVVAFSASLNSRIISGSSVAGTISGSSQLTSSYDSRYSLSGSVLTSFSSSVDNRLDTLEATIISGSPNYTQVLGNKRTGITLVDTSIISGSITTTGNPVQIMVTGDANPVNVSSWTRLQIFRDENAIGAVVQVENSSNLNVPYCLNVIDTPPVGTYTYSMRTVSGISGVFDFGEHTGPLLTAVELNSKTSFPSGTISGSSQLTSSFDTRYLNTGGDGVISGSSQLTSSFDTRYAISASFVSSSNLSSIQTITSASYAVLTPASGTLYIIIG